MTPAQAALARQLELEQVADRVDTLSISNQRGTIRAHTPNFDAEKDAEALKAALKGFGCDDKAIMSILCERSAEERKKISLTYKTLFGRSLAEDLKALHGNFESTIEALLMTRLEFDAWCLRHAMKGLSTDHHCLIEILASHSNAEIMAVRQTYQEMFSRNLEKDLESETGGHLKHLLVSLVQANRDESPTVDQEKVHVDAQALYNAGEARFWGSDTSKFNAILASRSYAHLRAVFAMYAKISQYDIERTIDHEMGGDTKAAFKAVVQVIKNRPAYFAERLYKSMKGIGTDDKTLVRLVVSRSEIDMENIKEEFLRLYQKTLAKMIEGDTSGDYKHALIKIVGLP